MGRRGRIRRIVIAAILGVVAVVLAVVTDTWSFYLTALAMVVVVISQLEDMPPRQG
jgi:hypothetical protein